MPPSDLPSERAIAELFDRVEGRVLHPGDVGYGDGRTVWNGRIDRYPSFVVRCAGVSDVVASVDFAREHGVALAVKGGGHDFAGHSVRDDGLVIDCSAMDSIEIDPDARVARVGPGATWAEFDERAQAHGLATTGATVSSVGIAGYTLGGGTGYLARSHGLAVDNLRAAEVVTANGAVVRASGDQQPDLFWALRGGGGNFGAAVAFEFDLHPVGPDVLAGQIVYPLEAAPGVLRHYRSFMDDAPTGVNCYAFVRPIPPLDSVPEHLHGAPGVALVAAFFGDLETGRAALAPLQEYGDPIFDGVQPRPYTELQRAFDEGVPAGERWYSKAQYLDELTDDAIDTFLEAIDPLRGPLTMAYLEPMGGAIAEVDVEATAFPHRNAAYSVHVLTGWSDSRRDDELVEWTESVHGALTPYSSGGVYVNLLDRDEADRVPDAYGANYERLRAVKREWDPGNLFDSNQNIEPGDAAME